MSEFIRGLACGQGDNVGGWIGRCTRGWSDDDEAFIRMVVGEREDLEMPSRGCWDVVITGSRGRCRSEETLAEGPARKDERVVVGRNPVDKVG